MPDKPMTCLLLLSICKMTELAYITLENEMDLTLAYKKSIQVAELIKLTVATQTVFATAVSEVSREIMDKAFEGACTIGFTQVKDRYALSAKLRFRIDEDFPKHNEGFDYARKLVPLMESSFSEQEGFVLLQMAIPTSSKMDGQKMVLIKRQISLQGPISAYEELKLRNAALSSTNQEQELELIHAKYLSEQKSEFLSIASHELNTPITILRALSQISLRLVDPNEIKLYGHLQKVEKQAGKLVTLTQQLLDVSKIEHGQFTYNKEWVPFKDFMLSVIESFKLLAPAHKISYELGADCEMQIDKNRIEQALANIVGNAIKYSEKGTTISIRTAVQDDVVRITVADEGIGMSNETLAKIFEKFYRSDMAHSQYKGLGIGLFVASKIISDHFGSINVKSEEGMGSSFAIDFPKLILR